MQGKLASFVLFLLGLFAIPASSEARVVRFVVNERSPFAGGAIWGNGGRYERIVATAYLEVDPRDPLNAVIVDLDLAPRNSRGFVEFSTAVLILKPLDPGRSNGKIYYTVNNRGNDALLNARSVADVGENDFALRMGYTIVDAGWEGDLEPTATRLVATLPIATQPDGSPIVGRMRVEYSNRNIPISGTFTLNLEGSSAFRSYEAADTNTTRSQLTVRDKVNGSKRAVASDQWAFGHCPNGKASLVASALDICHFDGFTSEKLYELIYPAKKPIVMGLGHATTRDVASFLRYETTDAAGNHNPVATGDTRVRRMYATGASQTGGYLRDFIYLGFNEDESHRRVFDGVIPTIAGTDRVFINVRFADPNVYSSQDVTHDFLQSSYPPYTYAVILDPITGIRDGIMKRPATDPLVFQIDSATEFWQLRGSLNVADVEGRPIPLPPNVRLYFQSSMGHGFTTSGLRTPTAVQTPMCENPVPTSVAEATRALLVAMDEWADRGNEPPPSNYPRIEDGNLVTLEKARREFPVIPGVRFPTSANNLGVVNFGPAFGRLGGVLQLQPPLMVGREIPMLVPSTDADGIDRAGIRSMQVRVPLGTSTGWNMRKAHRESDLCGLSGSFIAFAKTKAERSAAGDPRPSLEERYTDQSGFVRAVTKAANELVRARFLTKEDADRFVAAAKASSVLSK